MLVYAIIFINLALIFYTVGVWAEKIQGTLKKWHLVLFYIGLIFDTTGTLTMETIARNSTTSPSVFHGITGALAIILMLIHAIWATVVLIKNNKDTAKKFHKFSIVVWIIWLIPFLSGAMSHMI